MRTLRTWITHAGLAGVYGLSLTAAAAPVAAPSSVIEDNSFLLDEAYNQDPGVVQITQVFQILPSTGEWSHSPAIEFPIVTENHQITLQFPFSRPMGASLSLNDFALQYQYWLIHAKYFHLTPRIGAVFPTGNSTIGTGSGTVGAQAGLSTTVNFGDAFAFHTSGNAFLYPGSRATDGVATTTWDASIAASLIWRPLSWLNLLTEGVLTSDQTPLPGGSIGRDLLATVSPGARFSIRLGEHRTWEIVPGVAVPFTWRTSSPGSASISVLGYLSIEGPWW